jgi:tetratricopeptide (TPR) repeat protein
MSNRLAQARAERGWKKARLLFELRAAAEKRGEKLAKNESLSRRVAAWENQGETVSDFYRDLLCDVYGRTPAELGLIDVDVPVRPASVDISDRPRLNKIDSSLVDLLRGQTQSLRLLDRRLGGAAIYQQTTAHVAHLEHLVRYSLPGVHRKDAADELGQAAALAGWQALDSGLLDAAWRHHELAATASRESGIAPGMAYASAQQAYVLLDMGLAHEAHELIVAARQRISGPVPHELHAWLHAAEGEVLAVLGDRDRALRALDAAASVLPEVPENALPYVMLDPSHLARWRGHCLARLGDKSAIDDLSSALGAMGEGQYGRAEVSLRVDLALALRARGESAESRHHALAADELADRTGSQRQRRRIRELLSA